MGPNKVCQFAQIKVWELTDLMRTVVLGQVLQIEKLVWRQNPGWKQRQVGKDFVVHVAIYRQNMPKLNNYYVVNAICLLCIGISISRERK